MTSGLKNILQNKFFEWFIVACIFLNCILIGIETYFTNFVIDSIQYSILVVFAVEIFLRWVARESAKKFFSDAWNIFDLIIVLVSFLPESFFNNSSFANINSSLFTVIRVLRVFRVLRLIRTSDEVKLIFSVFIKSFRSLTYNAMFFFIFLYLYSIVGVILFRLPAKETASAEVLQKLEIHAKEAPNAPLVAPECYGSLDETMFTLFRLSTGEDWTDLRYNLLHARKTGLINATESVITIYHVSWYILSAYLLLNLLVGAILNNYQIIMEEHKKQKEEKE